MKTMELRTADGRRIARRVRMACSFTSRCVGWLRNASVGEHDGLLLSPGGSVHTMGMRFAIDVVFLSRQMRVLGLAPGVAPWRFRRAPAGTGRVLELAAGQIAAVELKLGTFVVVEPAADDEQGRLQITRRPPREACQRLPIQFSLRLPLGRSCAAHDGLERSAQEQSSPVTAQDEKRP